MSRAREFADLAGSADAGGLTGRNLIINGAMRIHQRTGTISATGFLVDRFSCTEQTSATFTGSQSTTAPAGFTNSSLITIGTGASATSTQYAIIGQNIEGNNIAGLGFGTSYAKNVTLSFWVRSSVTGTFCVSIKNSAANRAYIKEYTISVADTWEYKTLTFPGDTTGTWLTDNGIGIRLAFDLGSGSGTPTGAGDSWITTNATRTSNQTDFVSNSGATLYITGVQLELGETATPFEHRSFGDELARCQRYYAKSYSDGVAAGTVTSVGAIMVYSPATGNTMRYTLHYPQQMRATPTFTPYNPETGTSGYGAFEGQGATNQEVVGYTFNGNKSALLFNTNMNLTGSFYWQWSLDAEL
jgi:hypothetical protein